MNRPIEALQRRLLSAAQAVARPLRFMEVCGTHTVAVFRHGIRSLLPPNLKLISGPGCPVCVTSQAFIDAAVWLARQPNVILGTYGDMVRVPGATGSLEQARAQGAKVHVVLSARQVLDLARQNPTSQIVFLAVGFETTAPATAESVLLAQRDRIDNFTVLLAHKRIVPAMLALTATPQIQIDGFLCPGHVSVIIGSQAYQPVVRQAARPCVVAGFEPAQILLGLTRLTEMLAERRPNLENAYTVAVKPHGNRLAQDLLDRVFQPGPAVWRGLGPIDQSGLYLQPAYRHFDALTRFDVPAFPERQPAGCRCGEVIRGLLDPPQCPLFDGPCTPARPVGPCMVSSEGACQAWWKYQRVAV